jgi:deoxyribonuclease V
MKQPITHSWNVTPAEAIRIQNEMIRPAVRCRKVPRRAHRIGGADVSFDEDRKIAVAGIIVWDMVRREVVEQVYGVAPLRFPYVPGLLTFREGPAILAAWWKLACPPDVVMFDGTGYAHPRRCGLACHLGVLLDVPSIGVAKSRLCGAADEPGPRRGESTDWFDRGELVGRVVRTRDRVAPLFISVGHRATLDDAVRLTLACGTRYRLPEPTRLAHQFVTATKLRLAPASLPDPDAV